MATTKTLDKKTRAFRNFERGISSNSTKKMYVNSLFKFAELNNIKDFDELAKSGPEEIDAMLEDFIDDMAMRSIKGKSVKTALIGVERFFIMNDCIWHKDRIRLSIKKDMEKQGGKEAIQTEEIASMLSYTTAARTKALVHFLASTGVRAGVFVDPVLRMKHLYRMDDYYAVKVYAGSSEEYWTFLTPEAAAALDHYHNGRRRRGETLTSESPVFTNVDYCHDADCIAGNCSDRKQKDCTCQSNKCKRWFIDDENVRLIIGNLIRKAEIQRIKHGARFNHSTLHQFRKRFSTVLKMAGAQHDLVEVMLGHKNGICGIYFQPEREDLFQEFKKFAGALTVDLTERQKFEIEEKQTMIDLIEAEKDEIIAGMRKEMAEMKQSITILERTSVPQTSK